MVQVMPWRDLGRALATLLRRFETRHRDEVCCYELTPSQAHALDALAPQGTLTMSALASSLGLDLSSTTRLVAVLRQRGLLHVKTGRDQRVRDLSLTAPGLRLVERIERARAEWLAGALDGTPAAVLRELPAVVGRLAAGLGGGPPLVR